MKKIAIIIIAAGFLFVNGCKVTGEAGHPTGTHCYLATGLYLVFGHEWPDSGYVDDAFNTYKSDPDDRLLTFDSISTQAVQDYMEAGCRVAVQYHNGGGVEHSRPLFDAGELDRLPVTFVYVACDRKGGDQ